MHVKRSTGFIYKCSGHAGILNIELGNTEVLYQRCIAMEKILSRIEGRYNYEIFKKIYNSVPSIKLVEKG